MALFGPVIWLCAIAFLLQSCSLSVSAQKKTYIVHMKNSLKPASFATHAEWYSDNLQTLTTASSDSILYNYYAAYHGFAVTLTEEEAESLLQSDAVLQVSEDTVYNLHTTRTPEFLGLNKDLRPWAGKSMQELNKASQNVIIGVLDTGVSPESESFNDIGMTEVPTRWRGMCQLADDFDPDKDCNKKLIGAQFFAKGYSATTTTEEILSPRDYDGHGTHTASTAAGANVKNASLFGYASGVARGMVPFARLATYKVCWKTGCFASDILAGIEQAIKDGVDVMSMSLGGASVPYYLDTIATATFAAMKRGILVSCSAGNSGPTKGSLANVAPWLMTVGAGTLDRDFPASATLGNDKKYRGVSLYSGKGMGKTLVKLVYNSDGNGRLCIPGSLDSSIVKGTVVICDRGTNPRVEKGLVVKDAGGVGMILANTAENGEEMVADSHLLPALAVGLRYGDQIREYVKNATNPMAVLSFEGTVLNVKPSPVVAAFSSRGPNTLTPGILKPDVIGPGVNILAAWPKTVGPTGLRMDTRETEFNIISGTSMSCPHISGLAALVKAAHPDWSPSAIKSALMTTAYTVDNTNSSLLDAANNSTSNPYAYGSGYVDPAKALSPGLVYNTTSDDYISFLCSINYKTKQLQIISKRSDVTCAGRFRNPGQLNYPSFSVLFGNSKAVNYTRELTNVGAAGSVYTVSVEGPPEVVVRVKPAKLVFKNVGDKKLYTVTFKSNGRARHPFGRIVWTNELHEVGSPVAFTWPRQ